MVDDFDLDAAELRAGRADLPRFVEVLAVKLEDTLPQHTVVERRSVRFLSREKQVAAIDVDLGEEGFGLRRDGHRITAVRKKVVRGITIANEELPVADWVEALTRSIGREAGEASAAHVALSGLLG
ncbi:hypothetical protein [Patulibacter minatonensis]|uniref:hypothetical protein n=1 Tax=Patulibacter minatonensis TaxID=298163 RepID=UPI00047C30B0|nr:hypothetical protein [Patulibacter minatonensis]